MFIFKIMVHFHSIPFTPIPLEKKGDFEFEVF